VTIVGVQRPVWRVLRLVERTIDVRGQILITPDDMREGWTMTRPVG
jgi:hypothetical protein